MADNRNFLKELSELLKNKKIDEALNQVASFRKALVSLSKNKLDQIQKDILSKSKEPEEVVPEAKEEEVIVVEKAEEIVPEQPPVVEEEPAPKVITYKIKWGDTLWDIADTYYKNPWKYKFIAKHNNIKNPDHIISGTFIEIPEE